MIAWNIPTPCNHVPTVDFIPLLGACRWVLIWRRAHFSLVHIMMTWMPQWGCVTRTCKDVRKMKIDSWRIFAKVCVRVWDLAPAIRFSKVFRFVSGSGARLGWFFESLLVRLKRYVKWSQCHMCWHVWMWLVAKCWWGFLAGLMCHWAPGLEKSNDRHISIRNILGL